ncbi:MAG TPA: hypothetical protein PLG90_07045 [Ignavibacteria bacterium]|nr:hypothetical protein [Ignavibacteria bacterium]
MKNNKERYEELLFDLPDYISGKLNDKNRITEIENEINSNPEFKSEYENLNQTFTTLNKFSINEPSDAFFNNLLPKIHQKLSKPEPTIAKSLLQRFFPSLKYVLPAICIITFIYIYNFNNPSIVNISDSVLNKNSNNEILKSDSETVNFSENKNSESEKLYSDSGDNLKNLTVQNSSNNSDVQVINVVDIIPEQTSLFFNDTEIDEDFESYQLENLSREEEEAIISILNQEL